ncbi:ATP-binding cassette domain-containing protein [Mariniluteicoccus endophyticus]
MSLQATLAHAVRGVSVTLDVPSGTTLALVGPNGAGKSTVLGGLVGTVPPDVGSSVVLEGTEVAEVAIHRRRIALLGQEPLLFPHLTLLENVAFGPRAAGVGRAQARAAAAELLELVGVGDLGGRRPPEVSGGQAQRAAIARALATEPALLLLDEPLAALDAEVAPELRQVLRRVLAGRTTVLITHDLLDALAIADTVAVMEAGRIVEQGPAAEVLARPTSAFGARFAGVNLVAGTLTTRDGEGELVAGSTRVHGLGDGVTGAAVALFRPAVVSVHAVAPQGSPRNVFEAVVDSLEAHGSGVRVVTAHPDLGRVAADVTAAATAELGLEPGATVWLAVKAQAVELVAR